MKSIIEIIQNRRSYRSYKPIKLPEEILKKINPILQECPPGPYGNEATFLLVHKSHALDQKIKLGTYGFISGAQHFIVGTMQASAAGFVDFGYRMEWIILQLTALGLGTCWLGGSLKRSEFAKLIGLPENEVIPAVTPVGFPTEKQSVRDRLIRLGASSKKRKPWKEIFFDEDFSKPLTPENAGRYATALEMVRLAPSASNRQPWRIVKNGKFYHFYLQRTDRYYRLSPAIDLQKIDMGIAMCHFDLTAGALNLPGSWQTANPQISKSENREYLLSWKLE